MGAGAAPNADSVSHPPRRAHGDMCGVAVNAETYTTLVCACSTLPTHVVAVSCMHSACDCFCADGSRSVGPRHAAPVGRARNLGTEAMTRGAGWPRLAGRFSVRSEG
jgi:hypothetical protein